MHFLSVSSTGHLHGRTSVWMWLLHFAPPESCWENWYSNIRDSWTTCFARFSRVYRGIKAHHDSATYWTLLLWFCVEIPWWNYNLKLFPKLWNEEWSWIELPLLTFVKLLSVAPSVCFSVFFPYDKFFSVQRQEIDVFP